MAINQAITKYYPPGTRETPVVARSAAAETKPGKKAGKAAAPKPKAAAGPKRYFAQLSPEEQQKKTQMGYLTMCWATIGSVLIDQFVLFPAWTSAPGFLLFFMPLLIVPTVVWFVTKVYWK